MKYYKLKYTREYSFLVLGDIEAYVYDVGMMVLFYIDNNANLELSKVNNKSTFVSYF